MSDDPDEPEYRVYRGNSATPAGRGRRGDSAPPPADGRPPAPAQRRRAEDPEWTYNTYRSAPRGMLSRLRGETETDVGRRVAEAERLGAARSDESGSRQSRGSRSSRGSRPPKGSGWSRWGRGTWTWRRALKYVISALVGWVVLSVVLFFISAETKAGNLPAGLKQALTPSGSPMLFSPSNVLVLGLDNRPVGTHEPGANVNEADANTDSIMIWRVGGGVSRRLSIPRDTQVDLGGALGEEKINAAWSTAGGGSPALTVKAVENLTGIKINHVIVVDLANFPNFINDVGGVTVKNTSPVCSEISGGVANGGYTLNLKPGTHHLNGVQALTYARTRHNSCDLAYTDLQREAAQQEIMNGIKSQLFGLHTFTHLPWVAWDAPGVIQTDMGGLTLMQMFIASEMGGNPKPMLLSETAETDDLGDVLVPNAANIRAQVNKLLHG